MPTYAWEGRTRSGEARSGVIEAENEAGVAQQLRAQNITFSSIKRKGQKRNFSLGTGVGPKDLVVFTRQFSTMIDSGLPLVQALDILATQADNKRFAKVLFEVKGRVEGGSSFSEALRSQPKVFDDLFVNLVAAGEVAGILDSIMLRLTTYIEKAVKLRARVKGAMMYPSVVALVAITVIAVLLGKVIPVFENMFKDMGAGALPGLTQMVISFSRGFVKYFPFIAAVTTGIVIAIISALRTRKGKKFVHSMLLKLPILGPVIRKTVVARFTRTFGTLLSSGVPILDGMEIVAKTSGNLVVEDAIMECRQKVSEGRDVAGPLAQTKIFPPMVVQMIAVGEQTGAMDQMLQKIADFYEDEVDVAVASLTSLMEPLMIVGLGGIVGVIMIAMYMPIFELAGSIRGK